jgi:hypothetical protein
MGAGYLLVERLCDVELVALERIRLAVLEVVQ